MPWGCGGRRHFVRGDFADDVGPSLDVTCFNTKLTGGEQENGGKSFSSLAGALRW
jgi:hypothetical protein